MTSFSTLLPEHFSLLDNFIGNSCAKLQTKQTILKAEIKAEIKISSGALFL